MSFTGGVLAPTLALSLMAPSANLDGGAEPYSLLRAHFPPTAAGAEQKMVRTQAGRWLWNGIELYASDFKVAYAKNQQGQMVWFSGKIPESAVISQNLSAPWRSHSLHPTQVRSLFAERLRLGSWQIPDPQPVIHIQPEPSAWWKIVLPQNKRVFWLRESDGHWGEEKPIELGADALGLLYKENKVASTSSGLEEIPLIDLLDSSYLRNRLFRVLNCKDKSPSFKICGNFARSSDGRYEFSPDSLEYSEMVGYYSIQKAAQWHRGIQSEEQKKVFGDFGLTGPIDVFVRAIQPGAPSYSPRGSSVGSGNPVIYVPFSDDDLGLTNLSIDSDVYFHEFGHHIIYRSVIPPPGNYVQSYAIHEGLSDYFTYAITGNNVLAESVEVDGALRSGNLTASFSAQVLDFNGQQQAFYPAGELLSSVLWKLRTQLGEWKDGYFKMDKVVWDSVDLLPAQATLYQLACAIVKQSELFEKSEELAANSLRNVIVAEMVQRQFFANATVDPATGCPAVSDLLKELDEKESQPSILPSLDPKPAAVFTGEAASALPPFAGSLYQPVQQKRILCGDLSKGGGSANVPLSALVMLALPLCGVIFRRRPEAVPARVRRKSRSGPI
ncbi:MAG: hypothetical protein RLZZ488_2265 [Pseudomonadota bacterium]|jgi:hypothetical protein